MWGRITVEANPMTTITIPPEIEAPLTEAAKRQGTTPELLAVDCLRQQFVKPVPPPADGAKNLAEYLKDFIGCIDSSEKVPGGARMSENTGQKFTKLLVEQRNRERQ
jgi:hypothetical protein